MLFDDDEDDDLFGRSHRNSHKSDRFENSHDFDRFEISHDFDSEPTDMDFMIHNPKVDIWETTHPGEAIDPLYQLRKSFYGGDDWDKD
ncbi:MAG: hypothetical protein MJZ24_07215 [Paludibacteraceae bacterium]|nr:hypothetical protein [Paludibacteraceae bacterium]